MTWSETTTYAPELRVVVEVPTGLNDAAREQVRSLLTDWIEHPTRPLVLEAGARIRSIDCDGRVTPSDELVIQLPWWSFVLGAAVGGLVGALVVGVLS